MVHNKARSARLEEGKGHTFSDVAEKRYSGDKRGLGGQTSIHSHLAHALHLPRRNHLQHSIHSVRCEASDDGTVEEGMSVLCALTVKKVLEFARATCCKSAKDLQREGRSISETQCWSFPRLKSLLLTSAFDLQAVPRCHLQCLQMALGVSHGLVTDTHRRAMELARDGEVYTISKSVFSESKIENSSIVPPPGSPQNFDAAAYISGLDETDSVRVRACAKSSMMSKEDFVANKLDALDVVLPKECLLTVKQYLASLKGSDLVTVLRPVYKHGHSGKPSNNVHPARAAFCDFVQLHRKPTGRTVQTDGRYHGTEFFLDANFRAIKQQTGVGRKVLLSQNVLSSFFALACVESTPPMKAPSDSSVSNWFAEYFGKAGAVYGHTSLYPQKTDACSFCCEQIEKIQSLDASLRKHRLHTEDAGSLERQAAVRELTQEREQLQCELEEHRALAAHAQLLYRERLSGSRSDYLKLCETYFDLLGDDSDGNAVLAFAREASKLMFNLDADYQQDKSYPHWGVSPQPGPTYFMSKVTEYVHIIVAHNCGISDGISRLSRNVIYIRGQQCAGSKDCNDTVFTIFDYLANGMSTHPDPPLLRTGFNEDGSVAVGAGKLLQPESSLPVPLAQLVEDVICLASVERANVHRDQVVQACTLACDVLSHLAAQGIRVETRYDLLKVASTSLGSEGRSSRFESEAVAATSSLPMSELTAAAGILAISMRACPFVRAVFHSFDSCKGTNLSQFTVGGFALALAAGAIDAWLGRMQVVGHTKFKPDHVAQATGSKYNASDTWNEAHLLQHFRNYSVATVYDESLLVDLHESALFSSIPGISSSRSIILLAEDGELGESLGEPVDAPEDQAYPGA